MLFFRIYANEIPLHGKYMVRKYNYLKLYTLVRGMGFKLSFRNGNLSLTETTFIKN